MRFTQRRIELGSFRWLLVPSLPYLRHKVSYFDFVGTFGSDTSRGPPQLVGRDSGFSSNLSRETAIWCFTKPMRNMASNQH